MNKADDQRHKIPKTFDGDDTMTSTSILS